MNKLEYLKQLESALKGKITTDELDDIIRDYAEYFEEGKSQGKSEDEISQKLGIPFEVAQQILNDEKEVKSQGNENGFLKKNFFSNTAQKAKATRQPKEPKAPKEPKPPKPPKEPKGPRSSNRTANGCLGVLLAIFFTIILLPFAIVAVTIIACIILAVMVCGAVLGVVGIVAWIAISICSAFLPPVAVAAGIVLGLAMIAACVTIGIGVCWAVISLCKAVSRSIQSRSQARPVQASFTQEMYWQKTGNDTDYQEVPAEDQPKEEKEEGDDQRC